MPPSLDNALSVLRDNESELRRRGVLHASVFGSVARGTASPDSDVDVLIELDPEQRLSLFDYSALRLYVADLFDGAADVVNRRTLKPLLRDSVLSASVPVFQGSAGDRAAVSAFIKLAVSPEKLVVY